MKLQEFTVKNFNRSRKWGWGWSNQPTGEDAWTIEAPSRPDYVGTLKQIGEAKGEDRTYKSMQSGGTFTNARFFYDGKPVHSTWMFGMLSGNAYDDPNAKWGFGWFGGLHLPEYEDAATEIKIRVEA